MRVAIAILLVLAFVGNYFVLGIIFPEHLDDYDVFLKFYQVRNLVYEAMFVMGFYLSMASSNGLVKSLCKLGFILSFASFFDKCFGITWYLHSDVLLVMIAFEISVWQYLFYEDRRRSKSVLS